MEGVASNTELSKEITIDQIILTSVALLSFLGCLFIIYIYLWIFKLKSDYYKMIFFLGVADILYSTSFILNLFTNIETDHFMCIVQGGMQQYAFNTSTLIVFCLSFSVYTSKNKESTHFGTWYMAYLLPSLIIPGLITGWFIVNEAIGPAGPWCFVQMYKKEVYLQGTILVHGLYVFPMLVSCILYICAIRNVGEGILKSKSDYYKKLKWFPLLQLCFLPIIVVRQLNHFYENLFGDETVRNTVILICGIFACLNGFLNGLAYGWNSEAKRDLYDYHTQKDLNKKLLELKHV